MTAHNQDRAGHCFRALRGQYFRKSLPACSRWTIVISMVTPPPSSLRLRIISSRNKLMSSREMLFWIVFVTTMRLGPAGGVGSGGESTSGSVVDESSGALSGGDSGPMIGGVSSITSFAISEVTSNPEPRSVSKRLDIVSPKHIPSYSSPLYASA